MVRLAKASEGKVARQDQGRRFLRVGKTGVRADTSPRCIYVLSMQTAHGFRMIQRIGDIRGSGLKPGNEFERRVKQRPARNTRRQAVR